MPTDNKKQESLKILLTFKQSEKYLYDEIQKHSGKGNWVKDILREYLEANGKRPKGT
jgi:flagellar basal body-associated protein FliL